jgi:putative Holliday junction resolvase
LLDNTACFKIASFPFGNGAFFIPASTIDINGPIPYFKKMEEGRYLGLDLGGRRIGVAVSDPGGLIAQPLQTLIVRGIEDAVRQVCRAIAEHEVVGIVLGLPLNLSGDQSEQSKEVEKFAKHLRRVCPAPVYFEDERLSSRQAESILHSYGKKIKGHKEKIDRISAAIILQSFLDRKNRETAEPDK